MKITCKNCGREIDLVVLEPLTGDRQASCEHCKSQFTIRPKIGSDGFNVIFESDRKVVRICINCGNKFYSIPNEAIPVCSSCQHETVPLNTIGKGYYILRSSGKRLGPFQLDEIGKMINGGSINERETIETPQGDKFKAIEIPELAPYFKDFFVKSKKRGTAPKSTATDTVPLRTRGKLSRFLFIFLFVIAAAWIFLVVKATKKSVIKADPVQDLVIQWSGKNIVADKPYSYYFESGLAKLKKYTQASCNEARSDFVKAFLKNSGSCSALPFVSISLNCIYEYERNEKLLPLSLALADIAIARNPLDPAGYLAKGDAFAKQGNISDAKPLLDKARTLEPTNIFISALRASDLVADEQSSGEAEETLKKNLKEDPSLTFAHLALARQYFSKKEYKKAKESIDERINDSPDDSSLMLRVQINLLTKKYTEARNDLETVTRLSAFNTKAKVLLAQLLSEIFNESSKAEGMIQSVLESGEEISKTERADMNLLMAEIFIRHKRYGDAVEQCNSGLAIRPLDYELKFQKIRALYLSKRAQEGNQIIQDFVLGERDYPASINLKLAKFLEERRLYEEANEQYEKYINHSPVSFYAFAKLAIYLLSKKDGDKAKELMFDGMGKTFLFLNSDFLPDTRATIFKFDPDLVTKELEKAAASQLNSDFTTVAKAILIAQGETLDRGDANLERAGQILERVIGKDPTMKYAYAWLGFIYLRRGDVSRAEESLKKALEMDINDPALKLALAMVYSKRQNIETSASYLKEPLEDHGTLRFLAQIEDSKLDYSRGKKAPALDRLRTLQTERSDYYPLIMTLYRFGE